MPMKYLKDSIGIELRPSGKLLVVYTPANYEIYSDSVKVHETTLLFTQYYNGPGPFSETNLITRRFESCLYFRHQEKVILLKSFE